MHPLLAVTKFEEEMLLALANFRYLTLSQLMRLLQKESISNYARERLNGLIDQGIVAACYLPRVEKTGRTPRVYFLSDIGIQLFSNNTDQKNPAHHAQQLRKLYLPHTMAVNDILISAVLLEQRLEPAIRLCEFRAEHSLKQHLT